jgi:hypothetical protein
VGSIANGLNLRSVFTTASLIAPGFAIVDAPLGLTVTALQPGWSTITFSYQLQEIGIVPVGGILSASSGFGAFGFGFEQFQQVQTTVPADQSLNISRTISGTFTGSAFFDTIGSTNSFNARADSQVQYVPEPEPFWLLLAGLTTLAVWLGRRTDVSS